MTSAVRAMISIGMLAGFYLVAVVQLGLTIALAVWLADLLGLIGVLAVKLTLPLFAATVGSVVLGMWRAVRARPEPPHGLPVTAEQDPELWSELRALADEVGTRMPDEIRLVPEVNAAVMENSRLLGLIGGRRYLYLGLPLLQAMRGDQLRSVIAHELGHYSRRHTRLGAVAYRGRLAIAATVSRIGPYNVAGWVFKAYGNLYVLIDNAVVRRQEYEADRASARIAGRAAAVSALRELPVLSAAWDFYFDAYVSPGWESGYVPDDLSGGFAALMDARGDELSELREQGPQDERSKWDTHPPLTDRVAAIMVAPEAGTAADDRPAITMLADPADSGRRLQELAVDAAGRTVLPWPEFTHAALTAQMQRGADRILRVVARVTGEERPGVGTVLDMIEAGRLADLAQPLFPNATRRELGPMFAEPLAALLRLAAVHSGLARWRHSWSARAELVTADGGEPQVEEIAELAVTANGLPEARRRLADLGVDVAGAGLVERTASAVGARVIAAFTDVKVDNDTYDLLLLSQGFVFVPPGGAKDDGKDRLRRIIGSAPPAELARSHWFVPYEEVATASVTRETPTRAELGLHDGRRLAVHETWGSELIAKNSRDVLLEVLGRLGRG